MGTFNFSRNMFNNKKVVNIKINCTCKTTSQFNQFLKEIAWVIYCIYKNKITLKLYNTYDKAAD